MLEAGLRREVFPAASQASRRLERVRNTLIKNCDCDIQTLITVIL